MLAESTGVGITRKRGDEETSAHNSSGETEPHGPGSHRRRLEPVSTELSLDGLRLHSDEVDLAYKALRNSSTGRLSREQLAPVKPLFGVDANGRECLCPILRIESAVKSTQTDRELVYKAYELLGAWKEMEGGEDTGEVEFPFALKMVPPGFIKGACGKTFTDKMAQLHSALFDRVWPCVEDVDGATLPSEEDRDQLFQVLAGVGQFETEKGKNKAATRASAIYDWFYSVYVEGSQCTKVGEAFDPSFVVLDPVPAGIAGSIAAYAVAGTRPVGYALPIAWHGSNSVYQFGNQSHAEWFLSWLNGTVAGGVSGGVFVCSRAPTRIN